MNENNGNSRGLVNALNSVGQNLFGETVFSARIIHPEPQPQEPRLELFPLLAITQACL